MHHDLPHWNYFRLLERDLEESFRYVEPCPEHNQVYSDHFARIIVMACVEIENCFRRFAAEPPKPSKPKKISGYQQAVTTKCPLFTKMIIDMPRFNLDFLPWSGW